MDTSRGPYNPAILDQVGSGHPLPALASHYVPPHRSDYRPLLPPRVSDPLPAQHPGMRYGPSRLLDPRHPDPSQGLSIREPLPVQSLLFSGASAELESFLLDIQEQLRVFDGCFPSDKHKINWVAAHFGIRDRKYGTPSHTWLAGSSIR